MDLLKTVLEHGLYVLGHVVGGIIGGIIAGIALVFWLRNVRSIKWREFILTPETWLTKYRTRRQPSATQQLLNSSHKLLRKIKKCKIEDQARFQKMLQETFIGRRQLFSPIVHHISKVIDISRNDSTKSIQSELENWLERLNQSITHAHPRVASIGTELLESIDGSLVKAIVLADYSTPVAAILREIGKKHKSPERAIEVYLIQSSKHFISSQDTNRWISLFSEEDYRLFDLKPGLHSLDQCRDLFAQLDNKRTVLLIGVERIYAEGSIAVFPGMGLLTRAASQHGLQVVVAAESYKVQPLGRNEIEGLGSDSRSYPTTLELFEIRENMRLITDHRLHEHLSDDGLSSFHCCYRHWMNQMESRKFPIGIIFDLDGTIMDNESVHRDLYTQCAERVGYKLTKQEYDVALVGKSDVDIMNYLHQRKPKARVSVLDLVQDKQQKYKEYLKSGRLSAVEGAVPFIRMLSQSNFPLAVATSATLDELHACLEGLGISRCFKATVSTEMVKSGKPSPEIYREALRRLRISPSEGLVYEDSVAGVEAAVTAGISVIGVGAGIREQLSAAGAQKVIPNFRDHELLDTIL